MRHLVLLAALSALACGESTGANVPTREALADCWEGQSVDGLQLPLPQSEFRTLTWVGLTLQTSGLGQTIRYRDLQQSAGDPETRVSYTEYDVGLGIYPDSLHFFVGSSLVGEHASGRLLSPDVLEIDFQSSPTASRRGVYRFQRQHKAPNPFGTFICVVPSFG
jgi:hypothetical protein